MNHITESAIDKFAIELLEKQGYQYIYTPVIALIAKTQRENCHEEKISPYEPTKLLPLHRK